MFLGNYEKTFGWKTHNICIFLVKIYVENNGKFHTKLYDIVVTPHGVTAHGVTAPVGTGRNGKPLRRRGARTWQRANHSTWGSLAFDGSDSVVQTNPTVPSPCFAVDWKITIFQGAAKKWKPPTKMTAPYRYVPRCSGFLNVQIFWNQNFRRLENYWYYVF